MKTYVYKIKPNKVFEEKFNKWIGTCRFLYNSALELKQISYQQTGRSPSNYNIHKQLTEAKKEIPWIGDVGIHTLQATLDKLDRSYKAFFRGAGFPKWAAKHRWNSLPFKSCGQVDTTIFKLPKWGTIKVFKDRQPEGKIKIASIVKKADGYYLHVTTDAPFINPSENQAGLDMGINYFCVTSDGEYFENPRHFQQIKRKLRIANRSLSRKKQGSTRRVKQVQQLKKLYLKLSRQRQDFSHKISSKLASTYGILYMENLNIAGMLRNKNLAKHISDCGWYSFREKLSYKAKVELVDPKYTSQKCSECGTTDKNNRQTQSKFYCISCGHEENADLNASKNILLSGGTAIIRQREALACT